MRGTLVGCHTGPHCVRHRDGGFRPRYFMTDGRDSVVFHSNACQSPPHQRDLRTAYLMTWLCCSSYEPFILILVSSLAVVGSSPSSKREDLKSSSSARACALQPRPSCPLMGDERCLRGGFSPRQGSNIRPSAPRRLSVRRGRSWRGSSPCARPCARDLRFGDASEASAEAAARLELPLARTSLLCRDWCEGIAADLFAYVATHTSGPSLIRTDALSGSTTLPRTLRR